MFSRIPNLRNLIFFPVRNHVKTRNLFVCHEFQQWGFSKGTVRLYCVVDTGYGLGKSLGGLQTCIAGRSKVPNG